MSEKRITNQHVAQLLRSAASACTHGRHFTARQKIVQAAYELGIQPPIVAQTRLESAADEVVQSWEIFVQSWDTNHLDVAVNKLRDVLEYRRNHGDTRKVASRHGQAGN
jgi:hypothetical protein